MLEFLASGALVKTSLIGVIVGLAAYWFLKNRKYNMPPGPLRLPLLGNILQLGSDERYHIKFLEWSKTYGPVITVGLGPLKMVVVNNLDTAMEVLVKKSTDFAGRMTLPSSLQHVYTSNMMKKMDELTKSMVTDFLGRRFYEAKKSFNKDNIRHFTDTLLLARQEGETENGKTPEFLTDEYLIQTLSDIFFAGIDTSRYTLYFAILHMIAFPDIQRKCQEELDREIGKDRLPGVADRPNLGYTEAALHESMRLSTVAPSGLFHSALCDTDISGYMIPSGTLVMINHWALHNDPDAWDEVEKFKPERYLDENGRLGPKPPNWLPFSAGKRVCLGEFVAKPELHLLFAGLLQQFNCRLRPEPMLTLHLKAIYMQAYLIHTK